MARRATCSRWIASVSSSRCPTTTTIVTRVCATMDEQGVERAVFFPTLGVGIDGLNADDVRMTYKLFRAFNLWLDDDWGFNHDGRIYAAPFIPMLEPQLACDELDSVLERNSKLIVMRPGPAGGRSPADPAGIRSGPV